jgi:hypothetical protein
MTDKEILVIDYLKNSEEALVFVQGQGLTFLDIDFIWQILIYELEHYDNPAEVIFHNLKVKEITSCIIKYFDDNGLPIKNITLDDSIIPEALNSDLIKAKIKFKGETWTIHKNDKDTFPSQPHAHCYDRQYKLHLGNGKLYRKRDFIGKISSKDLLDLRQVIVQKININLPTYEND